MYSTSVLSSSASAPSSNIDTKPDERNSWFDLGALFWELGSETVETGAAIESTGRDGLASLSSIGLGVVVAGMEVGRISGSCYRR